MRSFLILTAALAAMFSVVPLITWAATGNWRAALDAAKGYGTVLGLMVGAAAVICVVMLAAGFVSG